MTIKYDVYKYRTDPRAASQMQFTRASESYHTIPDSTLRSIVATLARDSRRPAKDSGRRRSARDENETERRRSSEAESAYRSGSREGASLGRQGIGRKPWSTPETPTKDEDPAAYHDDVLEFLAARLDEDDLAEVENMLRGDESDEGDDSEEDTPEQWASSERIARRDAGELEPGARGRMAEQRRQIDDRPGEREVNPIGDSALIRDTLANARRIRIDPYMTAGDAAILRRAQKAARRPKQIAMDRREAKRLTSSASAKSFAERFPQAMRIGF